MTKLLHTLFLVFFSIFSFAQIRFESGYIIDNNNQRKEVLIKNVDWLNNPKSFEYKLDENSKIEIATIDAVKEFGVDELKYVRADVKIDRSSEDFNSISITEQPEFKEEMLYLKILVEGDATLLEYVDNNLVRYFFKDLTNSNPVQLVYKKYEVSVNQFSYNRTYRGQISQSFKCSTISLDKLRRLNYKQKELVKIFVEINECLDPDFVYKDNFKNSKIDFNLWIRPRLNNSKLLLSGNDQSVDFSNKTSFLGGVEAEFIFPFNKRKWSFIVEPTFQSYKVANAKVNNRYGYSESATVNYKNIEIPFGVRHYFFLDTKSKIFLNAQYMLNLNLDSYISFSRGDYEYRKLDINNRGNLALGIGYNYNNKLSAEFRFLTNRNILDYLNWESKFQTISFIVGYNIF